MFIGHSWDTPRTKTKKGMRPLYLKPQPEVSTLPKQLGQKGALENQEEPSWDGDSNGYTWYRNHSGDILDYIGNNMMIQWGYSLMMVSGTSRAICICILNTHVTNGTTAQAVSGSRGNGALSRNWTLPLLSTCTLALDTSSLLPWQYELIADRWPAVRVPRRCVLPCCSSCAALCHSCLPPWWLDVPCRAALFRRAVDMALFKNGVPQNKNFSVKHDEQPVDFGFILIFRQVCWRLAVWHCWDSVGCQKLPESGRALRHQRHCGSLDTCVWSLRP